MVSLNQRPLSLNTPSLKSFSLSASSCGFSQRICSCSLGFPGSLHSTNARIDFLLDVHTIDQFLNDRSSSGISASPDYAAASNHTFQVLAPKVVALPLVLSDGGVVGGNAVDEVAPSASTRSKRIALQKKAADAMVAAEDYARRFESGDLSAVSELPCISIRCIRVTLRAFCFRGLDSVTILVFLNFLKCEFLRLIASFGF